MINLIPTPKKYEIKGTEFHPIENKISVGKKEWELYAETFKTTFHKAFDIEITDGEGGFELIEDSSLAPDAYRIESGETFKIYASAVEGINYGMVSAYQLIKAKDGITEIQDLTVEDAPEKDYRAFMVDPGHVWHPFYTLLHYVDACYMAKIKYFHIHFIDNTVYSLPSRIYPKLSTEGQYYTFEQIAYLNEYAKARNVIIVPEYECPGHADQFIKKYPEIFGDELICEIDENDGKVDKSCGEVICATSEKCWEATKALIKEICDMFPDSPYINLGGDEASISVWNYCSCCKKYMEEHGIKNEYALYSDYIARVTDYVLTLGKIPMVFEGFPPEGSEKINKDTIVIAWDTEFHNVPDLLSAGFKVINASYQPLYIIGSLKYRWGALDILKWDMHMWTCHAHNHASHLNPVRVSPTEPVLGAMLCAWSLCYELSVQRVIECLGALSERTWTVKRVCFDDEYIPKHGKYQEIVGNIIRER